MGGNYDLKTKTFPKKFQHQDFSKKFLRPRLKILVLSPSPLLGDNHHGVLVGGLTLATEMCEKSTDVKDYFRQVCVIFVYEVDSIRCFRWSPY
jgi:hypothetical protein